MSDFIRKHDALKIIAHSCADLCDIAQNMRVQRQIEELDADPEQMAQELIDNCIATNKCEGCTFWTGHGCKIREPNEWDL